MSQAVVTASYGLRVKGGNYGTQPIQFLSAGKTRREGI